MEVVNEAVSYLNTHPEDLVVISSLLSVALQYGINHVKALSKLSNAVLGLVAVPGVITVATAFTTSLHITAYPIVALVGQVLYHAYEANKRRTENKVLAPITTSQVNVTNAEPSVDY